MAQRFLTVSATTRPPPIFTRSGIFSFHRLRFVAYSSCVNLRKLTRFRIRRQRDSLRPGAEPRGHASLRPPYIFNPGRNRCLARNESAADISPDSGRNRDSPASCSRRWARRPSPACSSPGPDRTMFRCCNAVLALARQTRKPMQTLMPRLSCAQPWRRYLRLPNTSSRNGSTAPNQAACAEWSV
jgi:hypothetical protein